MNAEVPEMRLEVGDLCTFNDPKDWRGKDHAVRIVTAVKVTSYHLGVPKIEDQRLERSMRSTPLTVYTRVTFSKVSEYTPPPIMQSTRNCAACQSTFLESMNWNSESSCCSELCSNNLVRACRRSECKQTFTRTTRQSYFCSSTCADEFNREHSFVYCPMFL